MMLFRFTLALGLSLAAQAAFAQDAARPVKLIEVAPSDAVLERKFFGQVAARRTVDLAFQVPGQIVELPVNEGETVPEGAPIAALDLEPFELALEQARLNKAQADRTLERLVNLRQTVSEVSIEDARTQASLAAIEVRNAEVALEDAELNAPFEALIASRYVEKFTTVDAGTPVVRVHDMGEIRVEIDVPEILFQRAGQDPEFDLTATFPAGDESYALELREFTAETSAVGQTFQLTLGMETPEDLVVLPGSSVTVAARLRVDDAGVEVPASALVAEPDGTTHVFVFEPAGERRGTLDRREVSVEIAADGAFRVQEGLAAGEEIVAAGAADLEAGMNVRRFEGFGQ